jgi:hypothetical protein
LDAHGVRDLRIDGEAFTLRVRACWGRGADIDALTLDRWPPRNIAVRRLDRPDDDGSGCGHVREGGRVRPAGGMNPSSESRGEIARRTTPARRRPSTAEDRL